MNEALEYLNRSLSIEERVKGKESLDWAVTIYNIGLVYKELNRD
jgi:hypothetical protein